MFDLDGTLADTARDMVNSLNILMERWDQQPIPFETLRPHVSNGTPALLRIGFDCSPGEDRYEELRVQFLDIYENNVCVHTELFPGMDELLKRMRRFRYEVGHRYQQAGIPDLATDQ